MLRVYIVWYVERLYYVICWQLFRKFRIVLRRFVAWEWFHLFFCQPFVKFKVALRHTTFILLTMLATSLALNFDTFMLYEVSRALWLCICSTALYWLKIPVIMSVVKLALADLHEDKEVFPAVLDEGFFGEILFFHKHLGVRITYC